MTKTIRAVFFLALVGVGCGETRERFETVQRAVSTGAQAALSARSVEQETPTTAAIAETVDAEQVPTATRDVDGSLRFVEDREHREIASVARRDGVTVTWVDGAHASVYVGFVDRDGRGATQGTRLFSSVVGEESVAWPTVVAAGDDIAVAWTDRDKGRVRFARLDAHGALLGRVRIVHDGINGPQHVRLSYNGRDFGLAAVLRSGVYFVRLNADGTRNGAPSVLSEGEPVRSLDAVEWDGRGFGLSFTVQREGRSEHVRQRISAHGLMANAG